MSQTHTLGDMPVMRAERPLSHSLTILIQVPKVKVDQIEQAASVRSAPRLSRCRQVSRPARRLRRRVRLAGCAVLALVPLVSLGTLGWKSHPTRLVACSIADEASGSAEGFLDRPAQRPAGAARIGTPIGSNGVVVLSIEPAISAPVPGTAVPVIFPGYVLPDDGLEEKAHEGS
jgi:hypothetical protein